VQHIAVTLLPSFELECMPWRPYIALRTSLAVMEGHFSTSGTRAFTRERTFGLSDFILASPKGRKQNDKSKKARKQEDEKRRKKK
jgi:hypothetical protein